MGLQALEAMFAATQAEGRAAFLPYYPVGYPDMARSLDALVAMAQAGVDGFEIGIPFQRPAGGRAHHTGSDAARA